MNKPEIITEPNFESKAEEIVFLRKTLDSERRRRYNVEHDLNEQSTMKACLCDPKKIIDFDKLNIIDKRLYAHTYWAELTDKQKRSFIDKDFKDAEESYKTKVKERMSDPNKMRAYFLTHSSPIMDDIIDMAKGSTSKASDSYAFKEVWEVLRGLINAANAKAPVLDLKGKEVSEQIDEILTQVTAGDITFDDAKQYMSLVSSGFNLQELPKLMAKLDALESS